VHIAAEIAPIAKVGGLGDVLGGLTYALLKENIDVEIFLPKYKNIKTHYLKNLKKAKENFEIYENEKWQKNTIYSALLNGVKIFLIKDQKNYLNSLKIYGYKNDPARFLYFNKVVLEFLKKRNEKIDILHLHDWHTSFIAPMYREIYSKQNHLIKAIVISIHNLYYQGQCKVQNIKNLHLAKNNFLDKLKDPNKKTKINLLKGGIIYSDFVTPVSENYAKEILMKKNSCGLYATLQKYKKKIKGVINGIDQNFWNPQKDIFLQHKFPQNFSQKELIQVKKQNKIHLQKKLNLNLENKPLICYIGRIAHQKGPKLIEHGILHSIKKNAQFVLLGSICEKPLQKTFYNLKKILKNNQNVSFNFEFNEKLSHEIFAASDFIIIPSLFEPCGLTQMIAFKYGVIPIVRNTGGLADTVFDLDDKSIKAAKRNGFAFNKFSNRQFGLTLNRAIKFWYENPNDFNDQITKNIKLDFSWKKSAKKYIEIYKKLL